jgi:hypothetical protein
MASEPVPQELAPQGQAKEAQSPRGFGSRPLNNYYSKIKNETSGARRL